jgi:hypothetical protein
MSDVWIIIDLIRGERERLEGCVKVGYAVLSEEADEVQPTNGEFAFRLRENGAVKM